MSAKIATDMAMALEGTLNRLVYTDRAHVREIVSGLLAVARVVADHGGMSLRDLQDNVDEMMEEAAIDLSPDEEEEA